MYIPGCLMWAELMLATSKGESPTGLDALIQVVQNDEAMMKLAVINLLSDLTNEVKHDPKGATKMGAASMAILEDLYKLRHG
jgi:hypothetical protein